MNQKDVERAKKVIMEVCWNADVEKCGISFNEIQEAYITAIACMELQKPKKPTIGLTTPDGYGTVWKLLKCINGHNLDNYEIEKYCRECGQAIDWSEE